MLLILLSFIMFLYVLYCVELNLPFNILYTTVEYMLEIK